MLTGVYLMGILQGLAISGLLWLGRLKFKANFWLGFLTITATCSIAAQYLVNTGTYASFGILFLFFTGCPFLLGPAILIYVKTSVNRVQNQGPLKLAHFVPALLYFLLLTYETLTTYDGEVRVFLSEAVTNAEYDQSPTISIMGLAKLLHLLVYSIASWRLIATRSTGLIPGKLKWIIIVYLILQLSLVAATVVDFYTPSYSLRIDDLFSLGLVGYLYVFAYSKVLEAGADNLTKVTAQPDTTYKKYYSSSLTPEKVDLHYQKLISFMESEKPHLEVKMNLGTLAERVGLNRHQLSQIINEKAQANFQDFMNGYRVEEVKHMLVTGRYDHYTLFSIALECGFNNKNSFNKAFKKHAGLTPSAYRRQVRDQQKKVS